MIRKIFIFEAIRCNRVLSKLEKDNTSIPFHIGYKLFQIIKKLNEIEEYVLYSMDNIFGGGVKLDEMNDEQKEVYQTIVCTQIEVELPDFPLDDFMKNTKINLSISEINDISILLDQKDNINSPISTF